MTPEEQQLCADLAPLQDRARHLWQPTGSYYTCAKCGEPYRGREGGCGERSGKRATLVCIMGAVLIACAYGAPSAWDWAVIQIGGTR